MALPRIASVFALLATASASSASDVLPEGALLRLGSWELRHVDPVSSVEFGAAGLMSVGLEGQVIIWSPEDGSLRTRERSPEGAYVAAAMSSDGRIFLAHGDGRLRVGPPGEGVLLATGELGARVAVTADGSLACMTGRDDHARLVDTRSGEVLHEVPLGGMSAVRAAFSPDGARVVVLGFNRLKALRRAGTQGQASGELFVIDVVEGLVKQRVESVERVLYDVAFTTDGAEVVAVDDRGSLSAWSVRDGARRLDSQPSTASPARAVAVSPDGELAVIVTDDGLLKTLSLTDGEVVQTRKVSHLPLSDVSVSLDGRRLAVAAGTEILLFELESLTPVDSSFRHIAPVSALVWSPDGTRIVSGSFDRTLRVWDAGSGEGLLAIQANAGFVYGVARSARGLFAAGQDGHVRLFDLEGEPLADLVAHSGACTAIALSPDEGTLASAGVDRVLQLFDPESGTPRHSVGGLAGLQFRLAWSPDGTQVAVGAGDVRIVSAETAEVLRTIPGMGAPLMALDWAADGRTLAAGLADRTIRLLDLEGGKTRWLEGHAGRITSLAFSPDGNRLASASENERGIRLWDLSEDRGVGSLGAYERDVSLLCWSPDGRRLVGGSMAGDLLVWDVSSDD